MLLLLLLAVEDMVWLGGGRDQSCLFGFVAAVAKRNQGSSSFENGRR